MSLATMTMTLWKDHIKKRDQSYFLLYFLSIREQQNTIVLLIVYACLCWNITLNFVNLIPIWDKHKTNHTQHDLTILPPVKRLVIFPHVLALSQYFTHGHIASPLNIRTTPKYHIQAILVHTYTWKCTQNSLMMDPNTQ